MNDNKQFWQKSAKLYKPFMQGNKKLYADICSGIAPYLTKDMKVLELACGSGQLSVPLAPKAGIWEATDFSENMIAEAKKNTVSAGLRFSLQDATDLHYPDESFDAAVISNALHIMPFPEKALAEIHRTLKSGGILFAPTFIHGDGNIFHIRVRLLELLGFHVYSNWDESEYLKFLEKNRFEIKEHYMLGSSVAPLSLAICIKA